MAISHADQNWRTLLKYLPADYEQLAVQHKVVNVQWANAQVRSAEALLRLFLVHVGADLPLRQTVAVVAQAGGTSVSHVVLHKKMRAAGPYLAELVARTVSLGGETAGERWSGYELCAVDATTACGPGAETTDARIHSVVRLADLRILQAHVTDAKGGETLRRFTWEPDQLVVADRGYSHAAGIAWVVSQRADVLVRVNHRAMPAYDDGGQIDVMSWLRELQGHRVTERAATLRGGSGKAMQLVTGRLVACRIPANKAAESRCRIRKEHGPSTTAEQLEMAEYVLLFTTAPTTRLSAAKCIDAYRLRWQVELMFKRWKSLCHFDRLPNYRDDTIRSWLTAKVLLGALLDKMGSDASELFPPPQRPIDRRSRAFRQTCGRSTARAPALEADEHPLADDHRRNPSASVS